MQILSDFSFFWLIPWAIISFLVAKWFYAKNTWFKGLAKKWQYVLLTSRSFVLFFVGLLLLGILLEAKNYREEKPIIISVIDNSSSLLNYKDSSSVRPTVKAYQKALKSTLEDDRKKSIFFR
jgi:hypothetical protein